MSSKQLKEQDITVIKNNGESEKWNPDKIYKCVKAACEGTNISPSQVMLDVDIKLQKRMKSTDIQDTLIKSVADKISESLEDIDNQKVAARLLNQKIRKQVYKQYKPLSFYDEIVKRVRKKYYDSNILDMYSEKEIKALQKVINYENDDNFMYLGLLQMHKKYLIRNKNNENIETPQEAFMLIGMYIFANEKNRMKYIKKFYKGLSTLKLVLSTPIAGGVRTLLRMYSSCAGLQVTDSQAGIAQSFEDIYKLTLNRAGIGANYGHIRGEGADIDKGREKHTGLVPILKVAEKISLSAMQPGAGRGGAITQYYPFFHYEIEHILELKNNKGTDDNRVRQSDHAIIFNDLFYERVKNNEDITLFYLNDVGDLYDQIGNTEYFKQKYKELENRRGIHKKKISAREVFKRFWIERLATGRMYLVNADAFQKHSAFKVPVYNSNLCLAGDTRITIRENGTEKEIYIKDVSKYKNIEVLSYNIETKKDEFKRITNSALMNSSAEVMELEFYNGTNDPNGLICTPDHKIWTQNRGYVKANDLEIYDELKFKNEFKRIVLRREKKKIPVYDITVEDNHNFYANDILVHNCTEINLPSFMYEDFKIKIKKGYTGAMDSLFEDMIAEGEWYNLYEYFHFNMELNDTDLNKTFKSFFAKPKDIKNNNFDIYTFNFYEIFVCILAGINLGIMGSYKEIEDNARILVRFLDNLIDYQDYPIPAMEKGATGRRALGISISGLFHYLAKKNLDYDTLEARDEIHRVMEALYYGAITESIEIAKEKGPCKYYRDTKYSDGLLTIDTYEKNVDELVTAEYQYDWDNVRKDLKEYGIRNSTLLTMVPASNSARTVNTISGIEPPQDLITVIEDKKMFSRMALPDLKKYKKFYEKNNIWNVDTVEYFKLIAVMQKFVDQSISLNQYNSYLKYADEKIPFSVLVEQNSTARKYGIKSLYYSKTQSDDEGKKHVDETESTCKGGACEL